MLKKEIFKRALFVSILSTIILISNPCILTAHETAKDKQTFADKIFEKDILRISLDSVEVLPGGRLKFYLSYINLSKKIRPVVPTADWHVQRVYLVDESGNEYDFIKSAVISKQKLLNSDVKYKAFIIFPGLIHTTKSLSLFSTYFSQFSDQAFYVIFKNIRLKQDKI